MEYIKLKQKIEEYNWDDGFSLPQQILDNPNCDLALALEIFYLADGYTYLENQVANPNLEKWSSFISNLYSNILDGKYIKTETTFEIPLSKMQKYNFRKKEIPEVFLKDL